MAVITGDSSDDLLNGTSGADEISGLGGNDTLNGAGGNDTLQGGNGNDSLAGGTGADSLVGGAGVDTLSGGGGDDEYVIDASDVLSDNGGIDTVRANFSYVLLPDFENLVLTGSGNIDGTGNDVANTITGNSGVNRLNGLAGGDTLIGNGASDTLDGGTGNDTMTGGTGSDTYVVDAVGDVVTELAAQGADLVQSSIDYTLLPDFEHLTLTGSASINGTGNGVGNTLTGNSGANLLSGLAGGDTLIGNGGADTLDGGAGNDALNGGNGNDVLVFQATDGSVQGGAGTDILRVAGVGISLDLTSISDAVYADMEVIDLAGTGNNTLNLSQSDARAISSTTDTLRVDANAGDVVTTADAGWLHMLNVKIGAQTYAQYTNGMATLQVDTDADRSGIDTTVSAIELSALSGANGFRLDGIDPNDRSGISVASAGDVNGDGFDDLIIGTFGADAGGVDGAGESYVVYGKASGFTSSIDLAALDGTNGFTLNGIDPFDYSGRSVSSAGDVNGDGYDDLIVGAPAGFNSNTNAGESFVVFGKASGFASSFDLGTLNGANGFRLDGVDVGDNSGRSVSAAGDVNGDGFDDLVIGAHLADPGGNNYAGVSYVVFGKASGFASSVDLSALTGADGFRLDGIDAFDNSGLSVAAAGDVNGDGFDDVVIGAPYAGPGGDSQAGESYVVFGKASGFASSVDLATLDGASGFRLDGIDAGDRSGYSVAAAGDVNGDGFDDLIVGAVYADPAGHLYAGESYVVFGKATGFASSIDLAALDGTNGFRLDGVDEYDDSGVSVATAGDVNGDGFDDLIVGAYFADSNENYTGASYVVFGKASGFASSVNFSTLDGTNGFRLDGIDASDESGCSVAAGGDVNGDGFDDLIIGAPYADPGGVVDAGESYVVFGGDFTGAVTHLGTSGANSLTGTAAAETFVSGQGNDTLAGGGGADVFNAGAGNDLIRVSSTTFADVDGGSGTDTLAILGGGRTLDLTALANNKITGIETIDITGGGDNTLDLGMGDLLDLSDTTNQLTVDGNTGDTVNLAGSWSDGGAGLVYHTYTQGAATILIDTDITLFFV